MSLPDLARDVLAFWFAGDEEARMHRWWRKDEAIDASIRDRFADLVVRAAGGAFDAWPETADGALALVIALDQFPRNMHRGSPLSFGCDAKAREVVAVALARGFDRELPLDRRPFLYMPLMHSERLADQERCVALFAALADESPGLAQQSDYAVQHRDIVARFGRFPHRNAVLGRASTAEEAEFLTQPGSSF